MRVIYVSQAEYPWDVRTEKICRSLTDAGHEVHILARNREMRAGTETLSEGTVHRIRPVVRLGRKLNALTSLPFFANPRWTSFIRSAVRELKPDILISRDLPLCPTCIRVAKGFGIPVVLDMAENYPEMIRDLWASGRQKPWDLLTRNPFLADRLERWCLSRVDRILVVVEESGHRAVRRGADPTKISIVSNTPPLKLTEAITDPPRIDQARETAKSNHPLELVYLGIMTRPRGIEELLQAVALLIGRGLEVRVRLLGDGRDLDLFRRMASQLQLGEDCVVFEGRVPYRDGLRALRAADVGVIPHRRSAHWDATVPNKLFDYMALGLPVLSPDSGPTARIIRETGCGVTYAIEDVSSLAEVIGALARDPAKRATMGEAGRSAVRSRYNWEQDEQVLLDVLGSLVSATRVTR